MKLTVTISQVDSSRYKLFQTDLTGIAATVAMLRNPYCDGTSHSSHPPCLIIWAGAKKTPQWWKDIGENRPAVRVLARIITNTVNASHATNWRESCPEATSLARRKSCPEATSLARRWRIVVADCL